VYNIILTFRQKISKLFYLSLYFYDYFNYRLKASIKCYETWRSVFSDFTGSGGGSHFWKILEELVFRFNTNIGIFYLQIHVHSGVPTFWRSNIQTFNQKRSEL